MNSPSGTMRCLAGLALALSAACGGGGPSGPNGPSGNGGLLSATINGTAWTADANLVQAPTPQKQGHHPLYGAKLVGQSTNGMQLNLVGIQGPGTYPLGTGGGVSGGTIAVNEGSAVWMTPISGAAGTVTVSTLTATRIAGTFQFTATAVPGGAATGTRVVTNGQFDIPFTLPPNLPPMAESDTGFMRATLGGSAWNGAVGSGGSVGQGTLIAIFVNDAYTLSVSLVPYTGPGVYQLGGANNAHRITVNQGTAGNSPCCWGGRTAFQNGQVVSLDAGTITITSATASRIRGTFSGTLAPALVGTATTNLAVTNGSFSFGFP